MKRDKTKIAFVYNIGRISRIAQVQNGQSPTEFFYGAIELERLGADIGIFEVNLAKPPGVLGGIVNLSYERGWVPEKLNGSALSETGKILSKLRHYGCIVATTSGIAFAIGSWNALGFICPPIVGIHCGLLNNSYPFVKKRLTAMLLRRMTTVLFGYGEINGVRNLVPGADIRVIPFGVDIDFWRPWPEINNCNRYILSVGNDGRRDYETLIDAADGIDVQFKILTQLKIPDHIPSNVEVIRGGWHSNGISDEELRALYRGASCVVVPLKETEQPSGQSVALQAMACGRPVVITKTKGLWSIDKIHDGENVILVPPRDTRALKDAMVALIQNDNFAKKVGSNARHTVEKYGNIESFASGILSACRDAVFSAKKGKHSL